jgi:DHA1 family inner membrane transport protein
MALRKPQVWFAIVAGAVGFGGMFALFSYVAPMATRVGGLPDSAVPVFLLTMGVGMVFGNWVAGRAMDWSLKKSLLGSPIALALALLAAWALAPYGYAALPALFAVTTFGSVLALGMMMRLIDAAEHAETLGAALSHGSLNIGNAVGAWLGGVTIAAGFGYRSPLALGVVLSLAGFAVLAVAFALDRDPDSHSETVRS